ncbi:MAG: lipopolysaccharide assembly protein LapA domain-containing protein [Alphaproteobacteria bacterium]|jgi:uncharacterized integral membrane protein|nr:lipopolysaccharide assembly protein LapA domain-containing protein [Alphaproteobacteria bacterium]
MRTISWIFSLPFLFLFLIFALKNSADVTISFWPINDVVSLPIPLFVLLLFGLGFVFATLLAGAKLFQVRWQVKKLTKENAALKAQLDEIQEEGEPEPVACEPMILYQGRYQTVRSSTSSAARPQTVPSKSWFRRKDNL